MDSCLDEERLVMLLLDLHFAGTDTSSNTILTALLYLTTYRDAQGRLPNTKLGFSVKTSQKKVHINKICTVKCAKASLVSKCAETEASYGFMFFSVKNYTQGVLILEKK